MKGILFFIFISISLINGQALPFDFETTITTNSFINFDGGEAMVIDNPQKNMSNPSNKVAVIVRNGGQVWAGSKIKLSNNLNFTTDNKIRLKIFTSAPVGTTLKLKLEGVGFAEKDIKTTTSNEWETVVWDFTGTPSVFNEIVFMFDFGKLGDGSINSTFYFDDVEQEFGGRQLDLPVTFEDGDVDYTLTDFEGAFSMLSKDPTDPTNNVGMAIKKSGAGASSGTTIGTSGGFASNIPLSLSNSKMSVRVWSPSAGTPIRLKVEDSKDPTHTCETQTNTTKSSEWETLIFDFVNQAPGTELLSIGLEKGWTYNMASIFFNFGTEGNANEQVYYFDDVRFGEGPSNSTFEIINNIKVFPNPSYNYWEIQSESNIIYRASLFSSEGKLIMVRDINEKYFNINNVQYNTGIYLLKLETNAGSDIIQLFKYKQ